MNKIDKIMFTLNTVFFIGIIIYIRNIKDTNMLVAIVGIYIMLLLWQKTMMEK